MSTNIEWTDQTDNIIVVKGGGWWCRKISPGCLNCYAEKLNQSSYFNGNKMLYTGKPPELILRSELVQSWATMRKPKKHFVASMTDIFGDWVPVTMAYEFLDGMLKAPSQTFQMLTKRPDVAGRIIRGWLELNHLPKLPSHMWIGASAENQEWANKRIVELIAIPATVRFLSVEPMLGEITFNFGQLMAGFPRHITREGNAVGAPLNIHWVIFGGESGTKARPCNLEWIRSGVTQCQAAGVACFVKQMGENYIHSDGLPYKFTDKKGGNPEEWPLDLRVRQFPSI